MSNKLTQIMFAIMVILMTGCSNNKTKIDQITDLQDKTMGMITSGISVDNANLMIQKLIGGPAKEIIYFKTGKDVLSALKTRKIDAMPVHQFTADYMLKKQSDLKQIPVQDQFEGGVIMAVRSQDQHLKTELDSAITILKGNGKIEALVDKWITNLPANIEPSNTKISKIEGAKTIYVGVSGEQVPLDYIGTDGRPAGFSVALLTEIGKVLSINFEFVSVNIQARFTALSNKKIDVIFCHFQSSDTNYFNDLKTRKWVGTIPYFTYRNGCFLVLK